MRVAAALLLLLACALLAAGCSIGRSSGNSAQAALALDLDDPDLAVLEPLERDLRRGERFYVRLQLGAPSEAEGVTVRIQRRVSGGSFFDVQEFHCDVEPPWNVTHLKLALPQTGDWNVTFILDSRKIADARVTVGTSPSSSTSPMPASPCATERG